MHLRTGQRFELPTPVGPTRFRLAARLTNVGWPPETIILNQPDYARAWLTSDPSAVEFDLRTGHLFAHVQLRPAQCSRRKPHPAWS
jgi:hypothetical protein